MLLALLPLCAQTTPQPAAATAPAPDNRAALTVSIEPAGDNDQGVVTRVTFRFSIPSDVPPDTPLVIQGAVTQGKLIRTFRYPLQPSQRSSLVAVLTMQPGDADIEARLVVPLETETPVIVGHAIAHATIAKRGTAFVASSNDGADAIVAEGTVPETNGAVRIRPPRRDVAPNLFIVDVDVESPVKRVEFWVEGKKILARNAPPYHAELDLGSLPKRVEVRAVGYDAQGRYVDADVWIVNERESPLEVKITRTATADNITHIKLSIQNPKNSAIRSITLFAGQKKLREFSDPPYALDVPTSKLAGVDFLRASVLDETNYEASDLLFLNGDHFGEEIDVSLVELPVTVLDASGAPVTGLTQGDFNVLEEKKPQKITSFNYATNLPLSIGVLIDHSGSMKPRMAATKKAAVEFFRDIVKPQDRAFVGGFAFDTTKLAPFVSGISSLEQQIEAIPDADGGTALYDAIVTGLYRFRSVQGRKALIILSDGEDTTSRLPYEEMLAYVRAARVPIYFIGIGLGIGDLSGTAKMKSLAAETGAVAYFIRNTDALAATYAQLEKDLRSQYLLTYNTQSTKKDQKYRTIEVNVSRPGTHVRTIRGFIP
jgi:Ca-activated chloride channel family protein